LLLNLKKATISHLKDDGSKSKCAVLLLTLVVIAIGTVAVVAVALSNKGMSFSGSLLSHDENESK
jgi:hypothetical protein